MKAEKDKKTGKWLIQFRYTDWQGVRRKTTKRGFATKREAEEYVRNFLASQQADFFNMNFQEFLKLYYDDMTPRLRENTMRNKKYIIDLKILPYFSNRRMNGIRKAIHKHISEQLTISLRRYSIMQFDIMTCRIILAAKPVEWVKTRLMR